MCSFCTEGVTDRKKCIRMQSALDKDIKLLKTLKRREEYCIHLIDTLRNEPNAYTAKCINSLVKDIQKIRRESIKSGELLESICDEL